MRLTTTLPLATLYFRQWDETDREVGIVLAKASFHRRADGRFIADPEAPELRLVDEFAEGEPGFAELKGEQELFPTKPATDLLVRGLARAPGGRLAKQWPVRIEIPEKLNYEFLVRGPSEWRVGLTGWTLTEPQAVSEVPLRYGLAYGGAGPGKRKGDPPEACELNPAGRGFASSGMLDRGDPFPAPQIGLLSDFASARVDKPMMVCGTMPIAKAWLPRRVEAGTFDDHWKETRHPMMPMDYSLRFWNCAPPGLQIIPHLKGDETIRLTGLSEGREPLEMTLPGVGLVATLHAESVNGAQQEPEPGCETSSLPLVVSTVELDVQAKDPSRHRITIVWAAAVPDPDAWEIGSIGAVRLAPRTPVKEDAA